MAGTDAAANGGDEALDDELLEAAAVAEGDPAAGREQGGSPALGADEDRFVDGTIGPSELAAERDEYRDAFLRVKAEFDNFRKRTAAERSDITARANAGLASQLLAVLDACDAALNHGATDVEPIHKQLLDVLAKEGLERMEPVGEPFDPNLHEAVLHEAADDEQDPAAVVVDELRAGYAWRGQVLRPAMVKVRG